MAIPRRKSLAGTNGIPLERDREYAVDFILGDLSNPSVGKGSVGKVVFVVHYSLKVGEGSRGLWWEGGRWFARK